MKKSEKKPNDDADSTRIVIRNFSEQEDWAVVALVAQVIKKGRVKRNETAYKKMSFGEPPVVVIEPKLNISSDTFFAWDVEQWTDEEKAIVAAKYLEEKNKKYAIRDARLAREAAAGEQS